MRQSHSISCDSAVWDSALRASQRHAELELYVVSLALGQPAVVVPIGRAMSVNNILGQQDLSIIYQTCCQTVRMRWIDTLLAVFDSLRAGGFASIWDPESLYEFAMRWRVYPEGCKSAASIATYEARRSINELVELHRLMLRANRAHSEAKELMNRAATDRLSRMASPKKRMVA